MSRSVNIVGWLSKLLLGLPGGGGAEAAAAAKAVDVVVGLRRGFSLREKVINLEEEDDDEFKLSNRLIL